MCFMNTLEREYGLEHRAKLFGDPSPVRRGFASLVAGLASTEAGRRDAVDVSRYQGPIDWYQVRGAVRTGLAIAKVSEGYGWVDPYFHANRSGMEAADFTHRVFYHWLSPSVPLSSQAAHVLRTVGTLERGEGIMLDLEQPGTTREMAKELADRVEQVAQRPVAGYTGRYVDGGRIWQSNQFFDGRRPRILAAYTSLARARQLAAPYAWDAWQWASTVFVAGIRPRVDINQVDNLSAFDAVCGRTFTPPTQEHDMTTLDVPRRAYDSRTPPARLAAGEVRVLPLATPGVRAVSVAITVANASGEGYLTAWGTGGDPGTTNVSFRAGTVATTAHSDVPCDPAGCVRIKATHDCDVIVDLQGEER